MPTKTTHSSFTNTKSHVLLLTVWLWSNTESFQAARKYGFFRKYIHNRVKQDHKGRRQEPLRTKTYLNLAGIFFLILKITKIARICVARRMIRITLVPSRALQVLGKALVKYITSKLFIDFNCGHCTCSL